MCYTIISMFYVKLFKKSNQYFKKSYLFDYIKGLSFLLKCKVIFLLFFFLLNAAGLIFPLAFNNFVTSSEHKVTFERNVRISNLLVKIL